jgi:hypothetical protein
MAMLRMLKRLYRRFVATPERPPRYRPERHYMRGVGPASLRKMGSGDAHAGASNDTSRENDAHRHKEPA